MFVQGILRDYNPWVTHRGREKQASSTIEETNDELLFKGDGLFGHDDMTSLVHEATKVCTYDIPKNDVNNTATEKGCNELLKEFSKLVEDAKATLYPGYRACTRLEFLITLLHIKVSCK